MTDHVSFEETITQAASAGRISWTLAHQFLTAGHASQEAREPLNDLLTYAAVRPTPDPRESQPVALKASRLTLDSGFPSYAERDVAFALYIADSPRAKWPQFWSGANPLEAFMLDLSLRNPGDHSALPGRSDQQLHDDLKALRGLPDSAWKHGRTEATLDERRRRAEWVKG